jgi:hypothetical protein
VKLVQNYTAEDIFPHFKTTGFNANAVVGGKDDNNGGISCDFLSELEVT